MTTSYSVQQIYTYFETRDKDGRGETKEKWAAIYSQMLSHAGDVLVDFKPQRSTSRNLVSSAEAAFTKMQEKKVPLYSGDTDEAKEEAAIKNHM